MNIIKLIIVGSGGFLGTIARYLMVRFCDQKLSAIFPYGTLAVNIIGSFTLGILYVLSQRYAGISDGWRLFLATGFCGGFTTFSSFALENFVMLNNNSAGTSALYVSISLAGGIIAIALGGWCTRFL